MYYIDLKQKEKCIETKINARFRKKNKKNKTTKYYKIF